MNNQRIFRIPVSIPARSSLLAIMLVVLLASTFAVASSPQGTFEKTFSVSGPVDLEVQTRSGDIIVRSGAAGSVSIRGKIFVGDHWLFGNRHADVSDIEQHPPLRQEGNSIRVDYVNARDISVDYEITVPADVEMGPDHWTATVHFTVPYVKWGMKNPSTLFSRVNDSVQIDLVATGSIGQQSTEPRSTVSPQ